MSDLTCSTDNCANLATRRGMCSKHHQLHYRDTLPDCSVEGCGRTAESRGWCVAHWERWKKYGDPRPDVPVRRRFKSPEEAIAENVTRDGECILWAGTVNSRGHGHLRMDGRMRLVHRFAWEKENGPIPEGMQIDHICHNPSCINVTHLRVATPAENSRHRRGATAANLSGYRGVSRNGRGWSATVGMGGKKHHLGTFDSPQEAAKVAAKKRAELFGEFAGGSHKKETRINNKEKYV